MVKVIPDCIGGGDRQVGKSEKKLLCKPDHGACRHQISIKIPCVLYDKLMVITLTILQGLWLAQAAVTERWP